MVMIIKPPFETVRQRNEIIANIRRDLTLCDSVEMVDFLKEEYRKELEAIRLDDTFNRPAPVSDLIDEEFEDRKRQLRERN